MAKISKAEGATNVGDPNLPPYLDTGEGEQSSVGTVYSESSESPRQSEDTTSHDQSLPAPTTESQSVVGQTESGTADTVGGEMETHRPRRRR